MTSNIVEPPFDQFLVTADKVAAARPGVDAELIREIFLEVATLLYNGLALDGLDEQDTRAVVAGLCVDLVSEDPGSAVRERAQAVLSEPGDLHDPQAASSAYLISAAMMKL